MKTVLSRDGAYFLVGPTASGKSETAHRIAELGGCDILSADSMLVYKGMDKGTAKPTEAQRRAVRYWGIDLVAPSESFSAGRFCEAAAIAAAQARADGRPLIVTGGTGLYVKALTHGLDPLPAAAPAKRAAWEKLLKEQGVEALAAALGALDKRRLDALKDLRNPRRLIRELELAEQSATRPGSWRKRAEPPAMPGLRWPRAELLERIRLRARRMFEDGLVEEVAALRERGVEFSATASAAIGYAEAIAALDGVMTEAEAIEATAARTARLAKRQMTWFRNQARIEWIAVGAGDSTERIAEKALECWARLGAIRLAV